MEESMFLSRTIKAAVEVEHNLRMPEGLTPQGEQAWKAVMTAVTRHIPHLDTGGCRAFWTPQEWLGKWGDPTDDRQPLLVVVYDGGDLYDLLSYEGDLQHARKDLQRLLTGLNLAFEDYSTWAMSIYPARGPQTLTR